MTLTDSEPQAAAVAISNEGCTRGVGGSASAGEGGEGGEGGECTKCGEDREDGEGGGGGEGGECGKAVCAGEIGDDRDPSEGLQTSPIASLTGGAWVGGVETTEPAKWTFLLPSL